MPYSVTTPPTGQVITTAEARAHIQETGSYYDTLLDAYIKAATDWIEQHCWIKLLTQEITAQLRCFPFSNSMIWLPGGPVQSITSINYIDTLGVSQLLASTEYMADLISQPSTIEPAPTKSWPSNREQPGGVTVVYQAGYGGASAVPLSIVHAVKLLVGSYFENRAGSIAGKPNSDGGVNRAVSALLDPYKVHHAALLPFV